MRFWTVGLDHVGENSFSPAFKPPRNGARTWKEELRGFTAVWLSRPPSQSTPKNNKRSRTILFVPARLSAFRPFNPGFPWPSPFQAPLKLLSSALLALYYPHLAPFLGHLPSAIGHLLSPIPLLCPFSTWPVKLWVQGWSHAPPPGASP